MEYKLCNKCNKNKYEYEFYTRENGKKRNECIECCKRRISKWARDKYKNDKEFKYNKKMYYLENKEKRLKQIKEWAKNNPESRSKYCVSWRWKLRMEIINAYGGECVCCHENIPEFLQIDHINNDGYKMRKEKKQLVGGSLYRWLKINNYPKDNFQLLCGNCNFAKGHFGGCPHND